MANEGRSPLSSSLPRVTNLFLNSGIRLVNGSQPPTFARKTSNQSKDDSLVTKGKPMSTGSSLPAVPACVAVLGRPRPMDISLSSDIVSSTSKSVAASPTSSITLKPPRIASAISPASSPTSVSTDSSQRQPVAMPTFSPCYLVDVEVKLKPGCADILLKDRVGVVRKVEGKTAMVHIKEHPSYITIPHESLVPVVPGPSDTVKVIGGNSGLIGLIGTLLSITAINREGLVQFLSWSNQRPRNNAQISLSHLGRYSPLTKFGSNSVSSIPSPGRVSSSSESTLPSSNTRVLKMTAPGIKLMPFSTSIVQQSSKSSPSVHPSGLPLSFLTPPPSSTKATTPKQISTFSPPQRSSFTTNLMSNVVARDGPAVATIPFACSALMFEQRSSPQQGGSMVRPRTGPSNGSVSPSLCQLAALSGSTIHKLRPPSGMGFGVDRDSPRTSKENNTSILLTKIAAMKNGFMPVSRGGGPEEEELSEVLEKLVKHQCDYLYELSSPSTPGDVKASCIRVSLVCPLGQQRMKYPSRGRSCKHLQCFDAENYISFHRKLIRRNRLKQAKGLQHRPPPLDKSWNCPICDKLAHPQHLYIDRALMKLVQETSAAEVELKDDGSWAPVENDPNLYELITVRVDYLTYTEMS